MNVIVDFFNIYKFQCYVYCGFFFFFCILLSHFLINYLGFYGVFIINIFSLILFWLSAVFLYYTSNLNNLQLFTVIGKWLTLNITYELPFELYCDGLSLNYTILTLTIAVSVILYTFAYFRYEPLVDRLIILICSFVISMILLVNAGNSVVLFLGWEGIGLTSFLLINFWTTRVATLKAAFKAFVFNKFSDVSLLIALLLIYNEFLTCNFLSLSVTSHLFQLHTYTFWTWSITTVDLIVFFLLLCAFIKSAQIGFHLWLPDSMEAPVPASALIHSATLISAGIFLILRFNYFFEATLWSQYVLQISGALTAFFGGICAIFQSDIKKLLAYSTISHCGFLMVLVSTHLTDFVMLYLFIHGFFKAASFLCVGLIIRFAGGYQDIRRMGGLFKFLPFEYFGLVVCLINLAGLPFSLGFYIKHLLFIGLDLSLFSAWFLFLNCFFGAICGLFYSFRLITTIFFDFKKSRKSTILHANNPQYKSYYYTNTTFAALLSVCFLIFNAYLFSSYLFFFVINASDLSNTFSDIINFTAQANNVWTNIMGNNYNISIFNWFFIIFIVFIVYSNFRKTINNMQLYFLFFYIISFVFLFYTNLCFFEIIFYLDWYIAEAIKWLQYITRR